MEESVQASRKKHRQTRVSQIPRRDEELRLHQGELTGTKLPRKATSQGKVPVPQTDTGRQVENTKARERTPVKELGKLTA